MQLLIGLGFPNAPPPAKPPKNIIWEGAGRFCKQCKKVAVLRVAPGAEQGLCYYCSSGLRLPPVYREDYVVPDVLKNGRARKPRRPKDTKRTRYV